MANNGEQIGAKLSHRCVKQRRLRASIPCADNHLTTATERIESALSCCTSSDPNRARHLPVFRQSPDPVPFERELLAGGRSRNKVRAQNRPPRRGLCNNSDAVIKQNRAADERNHGPIYVAGWANSAPESTRTKHRRRAVSTRFGSRQCQFFDMGSSGKLSNRPVRPDLIAILPSVGEYMRAR